MGNRIKYLLLDDGIKQKVLAERVGLTDNHLSRIVLGQIKPNGEIMMRIAAALGRPVESVFFLDDKADGA